MFFARMSSLDASSIVDTRAKNESDPEGSKESSQLEASERVAGASTAGPVPDQNPSFHKLLDVTQRGIG